MCCTPWKITPEHITGVRMKTIENYNSDNGFKNQAKEKINQKVYSA